MSTGTLSPALKRQGREADHSPPSSAEVKNGGPILPLPHTFSWRGTQLIKCRDNFIAVFAPAGYECAGCVASAMLLPSGTLQCRLDLRERCNLLYEVNELLYCCGLRRKTLGDLAVRAGLPIELYVAFMTMLCRRLITF
jgi:hypothetical protein